MASSASWTATGINKRSLREIRDKKQLRKNDPQIVENHGPVNRASAANNRQTLFPYNAVCLFRHYTARYSRKSGDAIRGKPLIYEKGFKIRLYCTSISHFHPQRGRTLPYNEMSLYCIGIM